MDTSNLRWSTRDMDKGVLLFGNGEYAWGAVRNVDTKIHYIVRGMDNVGEASTIEDAKQIVETLVALMNSEDL